jgi:signal transduction histidine kinase
MNSEPSTDAGKLSSNKLSSNARKMIALCDEILREWGVRLRATVKEAQQLPQPILINTFPALIDTLAQAISPDFPRTTATENDTVASEHGGERARLTNYNAQAVISEYQLLRWTIFDVLRRNEVLLDNDEFFIINASIDDSIREAANSFALAQAALRERFVAALTHDLRNPLAGASMAADLITMSSSEPKTKELAARITENLSRMNSMINDLLDAVVFQAGERLRLHLESFDMLALAHEVRDQLTAVHGRDIQVSGMTVNGTWDRAVIKRALENLVGNAVKYGAPDTPVRISVTAQHERVIVSVHNEGDPIPPEQAEFVFQVFRRAASAMEGEKQGWGLGLPFVRAVAESHGGSVGLDSAAERGTTFTIDIPVDARPFREAPTLAVKGE